MPARYQCFSLAGGWSWRLLGANNRVLARSPLPFADAVAAGRDALAVGALAPGEQIDLVSAAGSAWRWVLSVDGEVRAHSAVAYARRLECVRAVARFRECAPVAPVSGALAVFPGTSGLRQRHAGGPEH